LEAGDQRLAVAAQRCPPRCRRKRAESKNRRGKCETGELAEHTPNLGMGFALGYIPIYGRTGP